MFGFPKYVLYLGALLAVITVAGLVVHNIRENERLRIEKEIEDANRLSEDRAREGRRDVTLCYRNGGTWNRATGDCIFTDG